MATKLFNSFALPLTLALSFFSIVCIRLYGWMPEDGDYGKAFVAAPREWRRVAVPLRDRVWLCNREGTLRKPGEGGANPVLSVYP